MAKRKKFIITSLLLAFGFVSINMYITQNKFIGIGLLSLLSAFLFVWSLRESISLNATLLTLILPVLFTFGVGLFWFLLPTTLYTRIPIFLMYGLGIYGLISTMNIFTVSTTRSIALARAAKGVGFVLTLFTGFLLYDAALSLKSSLIITVLIITLSTFLLFIQGLWQSKLTHNLSRKIIVYSAISAYFISMISAMQYFWPVSVIVGSIFLTVCVYILLGLGQSNLEGRLFKQTVREYLTIGVFVFIAMILFTNWRA